MPQISRHKLDQDVQNRLLQLFWRSLSRLGSPEQAAEFFSDLLTSTEEIMLSKRYTIAILLTKGYAAKHIHDTLNVSFTTIGTVAGWLKNLKPATKKIIDRHLKDEAWRQFFDKIEAALDILPPGKYEDWSKAGKAKYRRSLNRSTRSALR